MIKETFRCDFEGWTAYQFGQVNRTFQKELIKIINDAGIQMENGSYTNQLARLLSQLQDEAGRRPAQTQASYEEQQRQPDSIPSIEVEEGAQRLQTPIRTNQRQQEQQKPIVRTDRTIRFRDHPDRSWDGIPSREQPAGVRTTTEPRTYQYISHEETPSAALTKASPEITYELPPVRNIQNGHIEATMISLFQKGWRSSRNYTGKPYDILFDKARYFEGYC